MGLVKVTVTLTATALATFSVAAITVSGLLLRVLMIAAMRGLSATEKMIAVKDSVGKVRETVTGTVTVLAFWSVAQRTVLARASKTMMIAVKSLRTYQIYAQL